MSTQELIFRLVFVVLGVVVVLALLIVELKLDEEALDMSVWVVGGVVAVLLIITAIVGPTAAAQFIVRG